MRYHWVDVYRGIAVLFMVILHFFVNIFPSNPPHFLDYSVRNVISIGDMALALFLFISGVSTYLSISKSRSGGKAVAHAIRRYSVIFIAGLVLDIILIASVGYVWWVLETIGLSGFIALLFICFPNKMKVLAIVVMGLCYSYIVSFPAVYRIISQFPNGGLLGSVSLSGIVLAGYMCEEYITKNGRQLILLLTGALLMLIGFVMSYFITYDRGIGTLPYIVFSSGFCIFSMVLLRWLVELKGISSRTLGDLGKSAFLIFVLNYPVLIFALALHINNSFSTWQAALITVILISLLVLASKLYVRFSEL